METFEAMALRVARDLWGSSGWLCDEHDITDYITRIRDELSKGQEPVGKVRERIEYDGTYDPPETIRYGDIPSTLPLGTELYLHPAPIPADMVLVPRGMVEETCPCCCQWSEDHSAAMIAA